MSKIYSPKIVQDGLVMCLDASQNKSYPAADLPVKNGLVMWMDAADDTTFSYSSGTTVSQWRDKSGFNYHMVPVSAGPTRNSSLASRKVLTFTTSQQIWNSSINLVTSAYTIFCVTRLTGTTNARVLSTQYVPSTGGNWLLGHWSGYVNQYYAEGWVSGPYGTAANTAWNVFMGDWSGSSTDLANLYTNGTAITTNSNGANSGPIGLGVNINSETSTCEAAEIVVFDRVLSVTERKQVNTYLGQKWGISNTDRSIIDLAGNNDNGLLGNGTVANMPVYNYYNKGGLRFNSSFSNYVISPNTTISGSQTFCVWAVMTGKQNSPTGVLSQHDYVSTANFGINILTSNQLAPSIGYTNGTREYQDKTTTGVISYNQIFNAVLVYNAGLNKIYWYINGVFDSDYSLSLTPKSTNWPIGLGRWDPSYDNYYFDGTIFSALVYNKALSPIEVAQNYEAQKSKFANTIVQQGLVLNLDAGNPYSYGGSGTTIYDVSPTSLSWTGSNVTYNSDPVKYFSYNGSNSWLQSSTSTAYDSQTITMECWCYPNTLSQEGFLFEKGQVNTQYSMFFESINATSFVFRTMGTVSNYNLTFNVNTYLTVSAWNHIVCTYNGSSKIAYVNGVQVASVAASGTLPTGQVNQYIGRHSGGYFFNGRIGESRVYNIALSAAQVLQNYNATKGRFGL
jgi:hypothetical protein